MQLILGDSTIDVSTKPILMGIVNATPDSFSDGGAFLDPVRAVEHAQSLVEQGADWLDIGGESTRPGAAPVSLEEELRRVIPVIERLSGMTSAVISIDTYKPEVARRALEAGACIINDVTGFRDPRMIEVAAMANATCIAMHMKGTPETMRDLAQYDDVTREVIDLLGERITAMTAGGIARERIIIDPGIGFAKRTEHSLTLIARLHDFQQLGRPVLLGVSRKRMIGEVTERPPESRVFGTVAANVVGYLHGARIFRIHDVAANRDALNVVSAIAARS